MAAAANYLCVWSLSAALIAGCGAHPVHVEYVQAQPVEQTPATLAPSAPVVATAGGPLKPGEGRSSTQLPREALEAPAPARPSYEVIEAANRAAVQEPRPDQYLNAVQSWPFELGAPYKIYTAPMYVTDVALRPGEKIQGQIAAGDTVRWLTATGTSVVNGVEQQHVYIKPTRPGLETNLVIQTDQRTYFAELYSFKTTHMVGVSWTYPREDFAAQVAHKNEVALAAKQYTPMNATNLADVHCDYVIKVIAGEPRWKPIAVCDDGYKTVIRFPRGMAQREAPVLFLQRGGHTHMANYLPQPQNGSYVIPRLIDGAELRLGQDDEAEVVHIARARR
jgi:type IV secretion system protein VirB9